MASSSLSIRRLLSPRSVFSFPKYPSRYPLSPLCTKPDTEVSDNPIPDMPDTPDTHPATLQRPLSFQRPLENNLDPGVYRAILVGQVGQAPVQKRLKSGRTVTLFSVGTGGIRNNRRPLDNEEPREYANRCAVQWHRITIYPERLGGVALNHVKPGSILYLEGNLETKIFSDPVTGLVRRIREIAIRRDGRLVFLGNETSGGQPAEKDLKGVGYY
ncbi:single-stranded DNA-binding protein, mitochondrial [Magnolia sinica]|uniref:single-stranded DNA-binding protein, mitochondrial n=1 Tax=Magnolia sinica TaxID=86752 RepID=UPI002658295D|nr:single-stranded DNA-binding protein, mitochondrial [Magnolia sinica]